MMKPRIKICCISSIEEARLAIQYGADALGLVGQMPSGPGPISDELIAAIARFTPPPVSTFLLTSETKAESIVHHYHRTQTHVIQIVDAIPVEAYHFLRARLPHVKLVQVIHVIDETSIADALVHAELADALLLDSGNPGLKVKELGGTGRTHDWSLSRRIVEQSNIPVFLAGGLHAGNVREAIDTVRPYGIDLCSGVRTGGHLDERKLAAFFNVAIDRGL